MTKGLKASRYPQAPLTIRLSDAGRRGGQLQAGWERAVGARRTCPSAESHKADIVMSAS